MLTIEQQTEILTLYYNEGRPVRAIARYMGINRDTVRRIIRRRTITSVKPTGVRPSILDPFKEVVDRDFKDNPYLTATAMLNKLRPFGYTGCYSVIKRYLSKKRSEIVRPRQAFLRLEFQPGEVAQVDWGEFGDVFNDGIKIHCFAMVLCHSRYIYLEFTRSEKFEDFIRCHENAFKFFGGVPRECWYDNLRTAVTDRLGGLIKFNSRFLAYMAHAGPRAHACNVARGNEKGRVEDLIKYTRMNFWPGREFLDFNDLNLQARLWRDEIANKREHRSTRKIPKLHFESQEKPALMGLNPNLYDTDEILTKVVPSDFHIIYETNRYSVPWTLSGITVTVRVTDMAIKVFYDQQPVTYHERSYLKNQIFTKDEHQKGLLDQKPGATREAWQLTAVNSIGPKMREYVDLLKSGERSLRSEISKILALATVYGEVAVHESCEDLLSRGIVGVAALEVTLKAKHHPAQSKLQPEPLKFMNQKLNRVVPVVDLRKYDALILESKRCNSAPEVNSNEKSDDVPSKPKPGGGGGSTSSSD
jgi:transposase